MSFSSTHSPAGGQPAIRVLVVDDQQKVRETLVWLLEQQADLQVVGEADHGEAALSLARQLRPQVIVMDARMPGLDGFEATRQVTRELPQIRVVIFSSADWPDAPQMAMSAGAAAYLEKGVSGEQLLAAIRQAARRTDELGNADL